MSVVPGPWVWSLGLDSTGSHDDTAWIDSALNSLYFDRQLVFGATMSEDYNTVEELKLLIIKGSRRQREKMVKKIEREVCDGESDGREAGREQRRGGHT